MKFSGEFGVCVWAVSGVSHVGLFMVSSSVAEKRVSQRQSDREQNRLKDD